MKTIFSALVFLFALSVLHPTPRYVKAGNTNPVPPYLTWATASDSIQKCINIAESGDTIFVGKGTYQERLFINYPLHLIGAGMDSCVIRTELLPPSSYWRIVSARAPISIEGFCLIDAVTQNSTAVSLRVAPDSLSAEYSIIKNCRFKVSTAAVYITDVNAEISDCISESAAIFSHTGASTRPYLILKNNVCNMKAPNTCFKTTLLAYNNIITTTDFAFQCVLSSSTFQNNVILSAKLNMHQIVGGVSGTLVINNVLAGKNSIGTIGLSGSGEVRNNVIINGNSGVWRADSFDTYTIKNNAFWNMLVNIANIPADSTNKTMFPMFVDELTNDFHLQKHSPLIDAGDPTIMDVDGTRSDIGVYGGPLGESYAYQDLAPLAPRGLFGTFYADSISLFWEKNNESDIKYYTVYMDTVPGFLPSTSSRVASVSHDSTVWWIHTTFPQRTWYFRLTATDSSGQESKPSDEIHLGITGIEGKPAFSEWRLYKNHPNPFNPTTKIGYNLKQNGYVKLIVYGISGEIMQILTNEEQTAGYHEVDFTAKKSGTWEAPASGVYIISLDVKGGNNLPLYRATDKMLFIK